MEGANEPNEPGDAPEPRLTLESVAEQMESMIGSSGEDFGANYASLVGTLETMDATIPLFERWAAEQGDVVKASVKYLMEMLDKYPDDYQRRVIEYLQQAIAEAEGTQQDPGVSDDEMGGAEQEPPQSPFEADVMDLVKTSTDVPAEFAGQTWNDVFETLENESEEYADIREWRMMQDPAVEELVRNSGVMHDIERGVLSRNVKLAWDRIIAGPARDAMGKTKSGFYPGFDRNFDQINSRLKVPFGEGLRRAPEWYKKLKKVTKEKVIKIETNIDK